MFQRSYQYLLPFLLLFLSACEQEVLLEDVISDTKVLQWKRCGFYQNSYPGKINFTVTDSVNSGWYTEFGDTSFFFFTLIDNETVQIDSSSNLAWSGQLNVTKYSSSSLEFERTYKSCDSELFYFE